MVLNPFMKTKSILSLGVSGLVCCAMLAGCIGPGLGVTSGRGGGSMMDYMDLQQKVFDNPDTDAWYEQRQKLALATGDRMFDKDFARVFDSLAQAVASLEIKVNNMERQSGYIAASDITLPPAERSAMDHEALNEWCRLNGIDSSNLESNPYFNSLGRQLVGTAGEPLMPGAGTGLTFQLVKMGTNQTKVKLRFSGVNYPRAVETHYKLVWQAVDKQIFVDKNIEGAVEKRQ